MNHYPDGVRESDLPGESKADRIRGKLLERFWEAVGDLEPGVVWAITADSKSQYILEERVNSWDNDSIESATADLEDWKDKHLCIDEPVRIQVVVAKGDSFADDEEDENGED